MLPVKITAAMKGFTLSKKKYVDVYNNRVSHFAKDWTFRSEIFKLKSFISNCKYENDILYIPINYSKSIVRAFTSYVTKGFDFDFQDEEVEAEVQRALRNGKFGGKLSKWANKQSYLGFGIMRVRFDEPNNRVIFDNIANKYYYGHTEWVGIWSDFLDIPAHTILNIYKDVELDKVVAQVDHYYKFNDKRIWQYSTHEYTSNSTTNVGREFDIKNAIWEVQEEVLDFLPIFVFNNDDNDDENEIDDDLQRRIKEHRTPGTLEEVPSPVFWTSDLVDTLDIQQEINDRTTQISKEFIQHLNSKVSYPESFAKRVQKAYSQGKEKDDAHIVLPTTERTSHAQGETPAQYTSKDVQHLALSFTHLDRMVKWLSAVTNVPGKFLGLDIGGSNEKVGALDKQFELFYYRVQNKREMAKPEIERMLAYVAWLLTGRTDLMPTVTFEPLKKTDIESNVKVYAEAKAAWLVSRETAVSKTFDLNEEETQIELEKIRGEENSNIARQQNTFLPTL